MRSFYLLFFVIFTLSSTLFAVPESNAESVAESLRDDSLDWASDFWPDKVKLTENFRPAEASVELLAGRYGVFLRVQDGLAVVDFGRYGTHFVPVASTDIISRFEEIRVSGKRGVGLFSKRMFNKFFLDRNGEYQPGREEDFLGRSYYIIVYADMGSEESEGITSWFLDRDNLLKLESLGSRPLIMPADDGEKELLRDVRALKWSEPVMYHWATEGFWKSFRFNLSQHPICIVIDKNGRVISSGNSVDFLNSVAGLLQGDSDEIESSYQKLFM